VAGGGPISRLCLPALLSLLAHDTPPDAVTEWGDEGWRVPVGR
jgi:hypothetical protein